MNYRSTEKIKEDISLLGFGCMRFPLNSDGGIDRERSAKLLRYAYDHGVNYFDTAYPYHGGESEEFVGEFLKELDRDSYKLATKLPCWKVKSLQDAKDIFAEQKKKLGVEYFDFYLLHAMNKGKWESMVSLGVVEYLEELQKNGEINYLGFSFHDSYPVFEQIITYRNWDFCQLQLNYMDMEVQAGIRGYELAKSRGTAVIVMEPVKGGNLARVPEEIAQMFEKAAPGASAASWALRYVASMDGVLTVLSGMSEEIQVEDNIKTFDDLVPFGKTEYDITEQAVKIFRSRVKNSCTGCRYCMPCPQKVNIAGCFSLWNKYGMFENTDAVKNTWNNDYDDEEKPVSCIACGKCETMCPQGISVISDLQRLNDELNSL